MMTVVVVVVVGSRMRIARVGMVGMMRGRTAGGR
jgi:hypothetical protein